MATRIDQFLQTGERVVYRAPRSGLCSPVTLPGRAGQGRWAPNMRNAHAKAFCAVFACRASGRMPAHAIVMRF